MRSSLRWVLALVVFALLLAGCSRATPNGVTLQNGEVVALYRPCQTDVIGRIDLYQGEDFARPPVWSARLVDHRRGTLAIPLVSSVPGYEIKSHLTGPLDRRRTYALDAHAPNGSEWSGATFRPGELRPGKIKQFGEFRDVASWRKGHTACVPMVLRVLSVGFGVVMVGGIAAAMVTLLVRRRRRAIPAA